MFYFMYFTGLIISKRKAKGYDTTEKDVTSALSDVLCNVKNWKSSTTTNATDKTTDG